jgi:hypothetical protein
MDLASPISTPALLGAFPAAATWTSASRRHHAIVRCLRDIGAIAVAVPAIAGLIIVSIWISAGRSSLLMRISALDRDGPAMGTQRNERRAGTR